MAASVSFSKGCFVCIIKFQNLANKVGLTFPINLILVLMFVKTLTSNREIRPVSNSCLARSFFGYFNFFNVIVYVVYLLRVWVALNPRFCRCMTKDVYGNVVNLWKLEYVIFSKNVIQVSVVFACLLSNITNGCHGFILFILYWCINILFTITYYFIYCLMKLHKWWIEINYFSGIANI